MPPVKGPYKLTLTKLDFLSAVDSPAQGKGAKAMLLKRKGDGAKVKLTAKVAKVNDELGLVFGYAFSTSLDGGSTPHIDYQDDAIDPDFLKAAVEFIERGGATDVNHDFAKDGRIVFAWPLLPEINKALGIDAKNVGLAVAIKPSAETFAKFKSGELTGFSIAGEGERVPLGKSLAKHLFERVLKEAVLTSNVDGHQHAIALDDPSTYWCDMYQTSYQNMEGAEQGHSHAWTFDATTGAITIAADSGHTHTVDAAVPADVLAAYAKLEAEKDAANAAIAAAPVVVVDEPSDGVPMPLAVEESSGATVVVNVLARDVASKGGGNSTPQEPVRTVKAQPEIKPMKLAKFAAILFAMSPAEQSAIVKMTDDDVDAFAAKPASEQTAILKAATDADAVVFKGEVTGIEVRKSDGAKMLELAKTNEATAATLAKREVEIAKAEIRKLAVEVLGGMPGDDETHDFIVASLRKGDDEVKTQRAIETLKGMRAETKIGKRAPGIGGTDAPITVTKRAAYIELEKGLLAFCVEKSIPAEKTWVDGLDAYVKTPAGAALYKAHDEAKAA